MADELETKEIDGKIFTKEERTGLFYETKEVDGKTHLRYEGDTLWQHRLDDWKEGEENEDAEA